MPPASMVLPPQTSGYPETDVTESFIHKLQLSVSRGLPHAAPVPSSRTEEHELVMIPSLARIVVLLCLFFRFMLTSWWGKWILLSAG